jgi:hypothetical protein
MSKMKQLEMMMSAEIEGSVNAVYYKTGVPSYDGNPLIECLPKLGSATEVINRLNRLPTNVLRTEPPGDRASELTTALSDMFVGLPQHYDLGIYLDTKIKQGYCSRNPGSNLNPQLLQSNYENMMRGKIVSALPRAEQFTSPPSGIIYGIAGCGKTSAFANLLSFYPHVVNHEKLGITQITYLYINFPHDGRLQTLCKNFFNAINKAINKPDHNWLERRETLDSMLAKMQSAVIHYNIGILVIDEFQMWRKKSNNSAEVISFLVSLINTVKLPIIFSGTPEAKGRLELNLASARRVSGFDVWDPLQMHSLENHKVEKSDLWDYFVQTLWPYQYLSKPPADFTEEINNTWFDCSQGIIDIAVKLFIQVQLRAIHSRKEMISAELIRHVYKNDFKSVHTIIAALSSGDPERVSQYPDLPQSEIAAKIASLKSSIEKINAKPADANLLPIAQEVLNMLIQLGYEKDVAQPAVEAAFTGNTSMDKQGLLVMAIDLLKEETEQEFKTKPKPAAKKTKPTPPDIITAQLGSLFDNIANQ